MPAIESETNGCNGLSAASDGKAVINGAFVKTNGIASQTRDASSLSYLGGLASLTSLHELYSQSAVAKIWGVAEKDLYTIEPPHLYPEYTKPGVSSYVYRELDFWTSGFFPGCLHLLLERQQKYRHPIHGIGLNVQPHPLQLEFACKWWTENIHRNATLLGTHDLGFMIAPWARLQWELHRDRRSFDTMLRAAETLADRFNGGVGALRSWDTCVTKIYKFSDPKNEFLVIIDNMMNLDLVFWAAANHPVPAEARRLYNIAVSHAKTTRKHHVAEDFSTTHVVNFDPTTGVVLEKLTNQGYSHGSCWSRGQAWAIAGFAQTAAWTGDDSFLQAAIDCAEYFLRRLPANSMVPPWDFDAPEADEHGQPRPTDTSAGLIAAYGMLLIHDLLRRRCEESRFLQACLRITNAICAVHLNPRAEFKESSQSLHTVEHGLLNDARRVTSTSLNDGDTIVNGATINNFEHAPRRWANHGLVYADYFFLLIGNKLLEMGIGGQLARPGL